ncbi:hypothetical protein DPMN_097197 [Dreissena polymorpha]|uniref:Uncharacterized protein n=1 Tax=Dreissena polymorpha TaxID=45954 RepID=A0A9D4LCT8_DREPO|nr:hypothetical protein DPMN_097197 [Dreissena polymorpha]
MRRERVSNLGRLSDNRPGNLEKHKYHETGIINELVDEGVSDTDEMERRLRSHVLETENVTPAPTSKSFFPNRNTIRNHMRNAEKTKQTSIDDETNLEGFEEDARRIITGGGCKEEDARRIITEGGCKEDNHRRRMQGG